MKRRIKLFSLVLSLILITVSVPMSVYSEEISQAENPELITENRFEDVQEGLEFVTSMDNINFQEDIYSTTETNTPTSQQITGLPDGIYSFEAAAHSKKFIKTASTSVIEGGTFTLTQYNTSPSIRYTQYANFRVTKISGTNRYIIRLMSNENLTLSFNGTNIITKTIPANDSDVAIQDTFYINYYNGGYTIQPYSSGNYLIPTSDSSGITLGSLSSSAIWYPRGYRTYIEDGVYMFANRGNLGLFMDTQYDSYLSGRHAQQYAYSSSPASSFSRGGLFRIKQDGNSGKYIIRLMTNNFLTWGTADDGYVISENISMDESEIGDEQKYYIVYDLSGFMLVPCNNYQKVISATPNSTASGNAGAPDSYLKIAMRSTATDSARWLMYKYIGSDRCGADIILPDEIESIGAIVGNTYTISHTVWYTKEDMFDFSVSAMNGALDDINIEYNSDNCTATITATNIGEISFYIFADYTVNNIPIRTVLDDIVFYVIPKEGTYYIQNSQSNLYANVINHSTDNGAIIHQLGFSTDSRFKWEIEHVEDSGGYVLLKSQLSNMYMGVDLDSSSTQTRIRQYEDVGDNTLWRFETLDNGSVKIICKATESSGKVLAVPDGTGEWLTQCVYTDDENVSDRWFALNITGTEGFLLGMTGDGQDRYTTLGKIMTPLTQLGYKDFNYTITNDIAYYDVQELMAEARVFVFRGHGGYGDISPYIALKCGGTVYSYNTLGAFDIYNFDNRTPVVNLSNCDLALFVGCKTGKSDFYSLPHAAVLSGATYAIGFKDSIGFSNANSWTEKFFEQLALGVAIDEAALNASENYNRNTDIGSYVIISFNH